MNATLIEKPPISDASLLSDAVLRACASGLGSYWVLSELGDWGAIRAVLRQEEAKGTLIRIQDDEGHRWILPEASPLITDGVDIDAVHRNPRWIQK